MSARYVFDDGGVWSQSPDDPPVQANPACVHDKVTGDEFDCSNESRLPELAAILNVAEQSKKRDALLARAVECLMTVYDEPRSVMDEREAIVAAYADLQGSLLPADL